jgi:hypothetical protein
MEKEMKICVVCKTPIAESLEIETPKGNVHPGVCLNMIQETNESLNESTSVDEIQMIL